MPQYATIPDLYVYGFREEARGEISDPVLNAHLAAASTKIDGYIGQRFGQPLATWTAEVVQWTCELAAFTSAKVRGIGAESPDYQVLKDSHDAVERLLSRTQRQDYTPVGLVPVTPPGPAGIQPSISSYSLVNIATGQRGPNRGWDGRGW